jgi:N-acetylmuramic acid 6-phosphate etherase
MFDATTSMDTNDSDGVFEEIKNLLTEKRNPASADIDRRPIEEVLSIINREDTTIAEVVRGEIPHIAKVVEAYEETLRKGGRVFYVGAGTSGRLGVLDAAELPPTFGTDPELVQGIIAGGYGALVRAKEGSEDDVDRAGADLKERNLSSSDMVIGLAACRRTPYVLAALAFARHVGAKTAFITCIPRDQVDVRVDALVCTAVGPEVVMGSTRMKAGTAEKLVLNMISTTVMIRMGKVFENMMVDLQATSRKLEERSKRVIMIATGAPYARAAELLRSARGSVKTALVMEIAGIPYEEAVRRLETADGFVRRALENPP